MIVHAAVIPTSVFPAPQGSTIIPERALLDYAMLGRQSPKNAEKKSDDTAPISKHFTQARLLIWADDRGRLEIYVKIGIHGIVTKIIFFQHGILELVATLLHVLGPKEVLRSAYTTRERTHVNLGIVDLKGVDIVIVLINLVWQLIRKQCPSDLNYRKTYHSPHRQQM